MARTPNEAGCHPAPRSTRWHQFFFIKTRGVLDIHVKYLYSIRVTDEMDLRPFLYCLYYAVQYLPDIFYLGRGSSFNLGHHSIIKETLYCNHLLTFYLLKSEEGREARNVTLFWSCYGINIHSHRSFKVCGIYLFSLFYWWRKYR